MIEMDQKEQILHYYRIDGLSLREISRRVGLNRKTVTRYVREYEASIREDPEEGVGHLPCQQAQVSCTQCRVYPHDGACMCRD